MAEEKNQNAQNTPPPPGNPDALRQEPAIRTMKSDIAAFMKETKPSLIQILTKQAELQTPPEERVRRPTPWMQIGIGAGAFIVLAASGWLVYQFLLVRPAKIPPSVEETAPTSPMLVEKTVTANVTRNPLVLFQALASAAETIEREGTFKRLIPAIKEANGETTTLGAADFFAILSVKAPAQISESLQGPLFVNFYYEAARPHMALVIPVKNLDRTFAGMISWESAIQRDLEVIFVGSPQEPVIAPFVDKTYRNIDYRFVVLNGRGIGYFLFAPKNLLVITTTESAVQLIINRLLEAR